MKNKINKLLIKLSDIKELEPLNYSVTKKRFAAWYSFNISYYNIDGSILSINYDTDYESYNTLIIKNSSISYSKEELEEEELLSLIKELFNRNIIKNLKLKSFELLYRVDNINNILESGKCYMWNNSSNFKDIKELLRLGYKEIDNPLCDNKEIILIDVNNKEFTLTHKHDEARF